MKISRLRSHNQRNPKEASPPTDEACGLSDFTHRQVQGVTLADPGSKSGAGAGVQYSGGLDGKETR
jgi:hypothetical protein